MTLFAPLRWKSFYIFRDALPHFIHKKLKINLRKGRGKANMERPLLFYF